MDLGEELTGVWRRLNDEQLYGSCSLSRYCSTDHKTRNNVGRACGTYVGKKEGRTWFWWGNENDKRPLGRTRRRWENSIKMDIQEIGLGTWIGLISLRIGKSGGEFFDYLGND